MRRRTTLGLLLLSLTVLATANTGCAHARHLQTVTVLTAKAALDLTQDTEPLTVCGTPTALPAPACIDNTVKDADGRTAHQRIHLVLADGYALHKQLAIAVRDWPQGAPQPAAIPGYLAQITALLDAVLLKAADIALAALRNQGVDKVPGLSFLEPAA